MISEWMIGLIRESAMEPHVITTVFYIETGRFRFTSVLIEEEPIAES